MMRWVVIAVGVMLDLLGTIWLLQGLNVLPGSFMTGSLFWAGMGVLLEIVGIGLIIFGARMRPASRA
jgi:hypothetical protein